jgi:propionate CoA-transferase
MEMSARKIIARRAAFELKPNSVVNLGIGMPEGVSNVANEEKILDFITLTAEPGVVGGTAGGGAEFRRGDQHRGLIDQPYQFDFYDGGGLDMAFLGLAQADRQGNLNVSKFGPNGRGRGLHQHQPERQKGGVRGHLHRRRARGCHRRRAAGRRRRGQGVRKFVQQVEHVTFSGPHAVENGQPVLYVTERCVFRLSPEAWCWRRSHRASIWSRTSWTRWTLSPSSTDPLRLMDPRIFQAEPMGLKADLLRVSLDRPAELQSRREPVFRQFRELSIDSRDDIEAVDAAVRRLLTPLGMRVSAIVNYDNFTIADPLVDAYTAMVKGLVDDLYSDVTRYTTSTFLRKKLGRALQRRQVAPHIYENRDEARDALNRMEGHGPGTAGRAK